MHLFKIISLLGFCSILSCTNNSNAKDVKTNNSIFADTNTVVNKRIIDSLDLYYQKQINKGFNGSVLVANKGKILYKRHFGYADRSQKIMLADEISTQLSSTSKPFTGTAILWLHQNRFLDINMPVNVYLKDFPYSNITVKMLLNHRSGLPNYTNTGLPKWYSKRPMYNIDLQLYLAKMKPRLNFTPDTRFQYCNTNYALLGRIVEEVSGIPFKQFLKELIFDPLGMKNTFVYDPQDDYSNRPMSISYQPNWAIFANTHEDGVYADKGIFSTVEDMLKWDQSFYSSKILSTNTLKAAYSGLPIDRTGVKKYGLGWRMLDFKNGQKMIFHNGWWHGNNSVFYRFIEENTTIIVLGNKYNKSIYDQGKGVYKMLRNTDPKRFGYTFDNDDSTDE